MTRTKTKISLLFLLWTSGWLSKIFGANDPALPAVKPARASTKSLSFKNNQGPL